MEHTCNDSVEDTSNCSAEAIGDVITPTAYALSFKAALLAIFLALVWGGLTPAIKITLEGIPPLMMAGMRFSISIVAIALWCWLHKLPMQLPTPLALCIVPLGIIFAVQIILLNLGTCWTSAARAGVFINTYPLFTALFAHFALPNDRLNLQKVIGLLLAFGGAVLMFIERCNAGNVRGDALVLLSAALVGVITIYSKYLLTQIDAYRLMLHQMLIGVILFFLAGSVFERGFAYHFNLRVVTALLYQGIAVGGFAFLTWVILLQRYAPSKLTAFAFTTPAFSILLSWALCGDALTQWLIVGTAMVGVGIALVN
ncbi:MAG TPA: DMT family transporter, partial [Armatimonadetes bacterium]|nr:DMT family transporter [Armatimonadota bacterium]